MAKKYTPSSALIIGIITAAAASGACVGAGLAQLPTADAPVLMSIESAMILSLGRAHGVEISTSSATDLVLTFTATMVGRGISQAAIGWLPGWGNAVNACTAAAVITGVGFAADQYFEAMKTERGE